MSSETRHASRLWDLVQDLFDLLSIKEAHQSVEVSLEFKFIDTFPQLLLGPAEHLSVHRSIDDQFLQDFHRCSCRVAHDEIGNRITHLDKRPDHHRRDSHVCNLGFFLRICATVPFDVRTDNMVAVQFVIRTVGSCDDQHGAVREFASSVDS